MKKLIAFVLSLVVLGIAAGAIIFSSISSSLPQIISVDDYKPRLVSDVYARGGERIGEYKYEVRKLTPFDKIPKLMVDAFLAIEDRQFYEHHGINYRAILRAAFLNFTSRGTRGASTITQQLAKQLFLSPEKTYTRKLKEAMLARRLEDHLTKEEILYLYLNQIFFGSGANGVAAAADVYFRKTLDQLTLGEIAIIAGLPQRPSAYSPIRNPKLAKGRQREVLNAMVAFGKITQEEADKAFNEPLKVHLEKEYNSIAPFAVETIRQILVEKIGDNKVNNEGIHVYTSIDAKKQIAANEEVRAGLREVDKRQGYRGPLRHLQTPEEQERFLTETRSKLQEDLSPIRIITPEGAVEQAVPPDFTKPYRRLDAKNQVVGNLPPYAPIGTETEALVTKIDDDLGLVYLRIAEAVALLDLENMDWARKPDPQMNAAYAPKLTRPSQALKVGDVILVRITGDRFVSPRSTELEKKMTAAQKLSPEHSFNLFAQAALEQAPIVQGALISFDLKTSEVVSIVGGYEFGKGDGKSEFNRAVQAKRQSGSSFKSIVYAAALDKGYNPATPIQDAPIVFGDDSATAEGQDTDIKKWKPHNHGGKFAGDILFRNALVRSLNVPTVKILESVGVSWVLDYAKRLGMFSPLNADLSLGLGSSSITLYEMTRTFSEFAKLGKRFKPVIVHRVSDHEGNDILKDITLDTFFEKELGPIEKEYEEKRLAFLGKTPSSNDSIAHTPETEASQQPDPANISNPSNSAEAQKRSVPHIYFEDPDQLISPQTAYVTTSLLSATITDPQGTGVRARNLARPAAGKTGSSNNYFDGWFVGYTPQYATGVWVGFDEERSIGAGEVGGRTALPIWLEYMKDIHGDDPALSFPVPSGIVFANIDSQTGKLASSSSKTVVNQAFVQGTEPSELSQSPTTRDDSDFYKEDMAE